jgi:hypothetical protein
MAPSGKRLRAAVSAVMRKAGQPLVLDNGSSVVKKWREIRANPRLLTVLSPDTTWPYVEMSPEPEGKITCYFLLDNFLFCSKSSILHAFTLMNSRQNTVSVHALILFNSRHSLTLRVCFIKRAIISPLGQELIRAKIKVSVSVIYVNGTNSGNKQQGCIPPQLSKGKAGSRHTLKNSKAVDLETARL